MQMVGIWCVWMWHELGKPHSFRLVELGPGRGTLMADLLRSTATFREFAMSVSADLVEVGTAVLLLWPTKWHWHKLAKFKRREQRERIAWADLGKCGPPCWDAALLKCFKRARSCQWYGDFLSVPSQVEHLGTPAQWHSHHALQE